MSALATIGRGDRLWLSPADSKVARQFGTVSDVILDADGRPELVVATLTRPEGGVTLLALSFLVPAPESVGDGSHG